MVTVGLSNYGYALLLTHLLSVGSYSRFAAGQGLILWATNVATVSVPWVLAQAVVRAKSDAERNSATQFAKFASAGSGVIAAVVVGAIATRFAGMSTALVVALSTFIIFLGTTTTGWLQGRERMRDLAVLLISENLLKNGAGVLLVMMARLGDAGALGAFGIGGVAMLVRWPRTDRAVRRSWRAALADRDLWRHAVGIAGAQGVVSLFIAVNVVLVALLPGNRALAASYQASATLSRIPLYIAGAVGTAFFPSLARRTADGLIAVRAVRMYASVALPLAIVLATIPAPLLALVFPTQYGAVAALLKFTAVTGVAAGGISLITAFFQAASDYSCLWWLGAGLAVYVGSLLAGWRIDGIVGLACGGGIGSAIALGLMGYRLARRQGVGVFTSIPLLLPIAAATMLFLLRPHPWIWFPAAALVGLQASMRFLRPGARHARSWVASRRRSGNELSPERLLTDSVWHGMVHKPTRAELQRALRLARRNQVEGRLARVYPKELSGVLTKVGVASEAFTRDLNQVVGLLNDAGIAAILIKGNPRSDQVCTGIDLVVAERNRCASVRVLDDWYSHPSGESSEHPEYGVYCLPDGLVVHLRTDLSWLGVPIATDRLFERAQRSNHRAFVPSASDYLMICLAHAIFHSLELNLSELIAVEKLMYPEVIGAARAEASRGGWLASFDHALAVAMEAIDRLDQGLTLSLPSSLLVFHSHVPGAGCPASTEALSS